MSVFSYSDLGISKIGDKADRKVLWTAAGKTGVKGRAHAWIVAEDALSCSNDMSSRYKCCIVSYGPCNYVVVICESYPTSTNERRRGPVVIRCHMIPDGVVRNSMLCSSCDN